MTDTQQDGVASWGRWLLGAIPDMTCRTIAQARLGLDRAVGGAPPTVVVFLVPLIGKARSSDWGAVQANLRNTLATIAAQTHLSVEVVVCGQDDPGGLDRPGWRFVRYPWAAPMPGARSDKFGKIVFMFDDLRRRRFRGYAMQLDADDLVHPSLAENVLRQDNRHGYLIEEGVMYDALTNEIGLLGPRTAEHPGRRPFHSICGSCVILYVNFASRVTAWLYRRMAAARRSGHNVYPAVLRRYGVFLEVMPFPACAYTVNHGVSISEQKGKAGWRSSYIARHPVGDATAEASLRQAFGLPARAASASIDA